MVQQVILIQVEIDVVGLGLIVVACEFIHFTNVLRLSFVHVAEIIEDISFGYFSIEYG
jgi:hypothetical protein